MKTILVENEQFSCLDISFLGEDERAMWFRIDEEGHSLVGNIFGVADFKVVDGGNEVEYDFYTTEGVSMEEMKPIIDDFVVVVLGESNENKSVE